MVKAIVQEKLKKYAEVLDSFEKNNSNTIPLCAAEPIISRLVKAPLSSPFSERYIKSGIKNFDASKEFIGSQYIYPVYQLISEICLDLFGAKYADARPLSGMNAALTSLMSITNPGDDILLLHPDAGAHESYPQICERLGLKTRYLPFDLDNIRYDIEETNKLLNSRTYKAIVIPPSDLIDQPPLDRLNIPDDTIVFYDCTQSFGLIASEHHFNPMKLPNKVVLLGGTHKTISGPTCGLILCNDECLSTILEQKITPIYVRNPHPHHVASLLMALVEFLECGGEYMTNVILNSNMLGKLLSEYGFSIKKADRLNYSNTHQLFISLDESAARNIERNARLLNISLDKKSKKMYGDAGIRIGVQAITRLGWREKELDTLARLLSKMRNEEPNSSMINLANQLRNRNRNKLEYTIDASAHEFLDT